jgi:hypothetical protein
MMRFIVSSFLLAPLQKRDGHTIGITDLEQCRTPRRALWLWSADRDSLMDRVDVGNFDHDVNSIARREYPHRVRFSLVVENFEGHAFGVEAATATMFAVPFVDDLKS